MNNKLPKAMNTEGKKVEQFQSLKQSSIFFRIKKKVEKIQLAAFAIDFINRNEIEWGLG